VPKTRLTATPSWPSNRRPRTSLLIAVSTVVVAATVVACSSSAKTASSTAPPSTSAPAPSAAVSAASSAAASVPAPASTSAAASASAPAASAAAATSVGTAPVTLQLMVTTPDVALYTALGAAFHAKYSNVTVKVSSQDYNSLVTNAPRLISGGDVPDLIRLASFGNLVKDNLITDLDPYAAAYGWNQWPQSQFASTRIASNGTQRGTGALYGVGPGFGLTGVYYNKALAAQIGMTTPPATLADFEQLLAKAKAAGLLPIMINGKDGGQIFPLQNLEMDFAGGTQQVENWIYDTPGATINTPATVQAATTLQQWSKDGYFPSDVTSIDQTAAPSDFESGKGVFFPSGNWQAPGLDKSAPGKFGFFLFPPSTAGGSFSAMTATDLLAIPTKSKNAAVAAAFLNFIQVDPGARQDTLTLGGVVPAGPADAAAPTATAGSVVDATVSSFQQLVKSNGLADFLANATASIQVNTLLPQSQLLMAGKTSPTAFATKLQSDYASSLGN
jgi:raffinose/stachyose/melibiose transport system substrate-binding protein